VDLAVNQTIANPGDRHRQHPAHHLRWWIWPLLIVLLSMSLMIAIRVHGWTRWQAAQADLERLGIPTTAAAYLATAPPVDHERHQRLERALRTLNLGWNTGLPFCDVRTGALAPAIYESLCNSLRLADADLREIGSVLDEGPVLLSVFGWIDRDPQSQENFAPEKSFPEAAPSSRATRTCAEMWALRATLDPDPTFGLHRLDQWQKANDQPGLVCDATTAVAISALRDDAYLWLATRGRLADGQLESWVAEQPPHHRWGAAALTGERCLIWEPLMHAHVLSAVILGMGAWSEDLSSRFGVFRFHQGAWTCTELARHEARLRGTPLPTHPPQIPWAVHLYPNVTVPNLSNWMHTLNQGSFHHRLVRIAGLLAARHAAGRALPESASELTQILPTGRLDGVGSNQPAICYQRLSPTRFRLGLAPAQAQHAVAPTTPWENAPGTTIGMPASPDSVDNRTWSREIDLAAIFQPLPAPLPLPMMGQ
jgi:hypothetical protein